jgi:esterase/lipase
MASLTETQRQVAIEALQLVLSSSEALEEKNRELLESTREMLDQHSLEYTEQEIRDAMTRLVKIYNGLEIVSARKDAHVDCFLVHGQFVAPTTRSQNQVPVLSRLALLFQPDLLERYPDSILGIRFTRREDS